jgi:flotillin
MTTIMYVSAILAVVIILTIIGVLSRYRRCKPNQVLVVYGKTGGEKKSAKLYHGGAAFVLPIIQSYDVLSMEPMQIDCKLTGALSSQNIRVDVPTTITVAISTNPEIMQNAAERLLGMDTESTENLITDIVYGQMRLIIAEMTIEKLNSDRDEFLDKARKNIDNELNKLGLYLLNINISDIRDEAGYIMNLGKEAESRALNEAQANIEEQEKLGAIKIAVQQKEKETAVANTKKEQEIQIACTEKEKETIVAETKKEKEIALALTDKEKQIGVAQADRDRAAVIAKTLTDKESAIVRSKAELEVNKAEAERMEEVGKNKAEADKEAAIAIQDSEAQIKKAEKNASIGYNNAQKEVAVSVSELQIIKAQSEKKAGEEKVKSEAAVKTAKELADKEVEEAKAKKVQAALKAEKIVPAETQKEEAILQADAEAEKIKRRAEAAAHLAKAEAEAKAIQMKLEAEAEGKKKSLMAEADGFKAMVEAAESNPQIAIQYKMVNQWKEIAGEQVKAFEHINLGNITVFDGGQNSTGNFLNNVVKTVAPALGVIDQLPIADTLKKLKGDDKK